jgi:signal transduction histidine kinase
MKCWLVIIFIGILINPVFAQVETYRDADRLLKKLAATTTDTTRIILKCKLGEAYRANQPDTSLQLATEALSESGRIGFRRGQVTALLVFCVLAREKGDLPNALEYGLRALKICEQDGYPFEEIYTLIRIANVYFAVRDLSKAVVYINKSNERLKTHYDQFQWSVTQHFLADAYEQMGKLDSAEMIVKVLEEKHPSEPIWIVLNNRLRGNIALKRKDLPLAIAYYRKSNNAAMAETAYREAATASNAMAQAFKRLNQPDSAIFYAKQGLKFGEMLAYRNRILAASNLLAELYSERDPAEAIKYYQIASAAKDSLYGVQKFQQLQSATMKEQERQTELEAARLAYRNRLRQWALLGGAAVFVIIAAILFRNNRQKQQANKMLERTLADLRNTQAQLIQSEKMASLGELTAGIAHEIQNPLNFVNNFTEVNNELIDELRGQRENLKKEELEEILNDIYKNNEKISHHGKRADAIVKGMLQHSRSSTGQKEPTDLNTLTAEYLRLAYHGLRAKDKTFNATIETEFDAGIGKVNVVPQDIGRVILNLVNNAFYAVNEKHKAAGNGYQPTVKLETRKVGGKIELRVIDNGNGIPKQTLDKIFQPFFTTKPTGEGTGLGLSLSYDIITKGHGGEITVRTNENEGTSFIITIPTNK